MNFEKINIKKVLFIVFVILISGYVVYDISLEVVNHFRLQGNEIAIRGIIAFAENENCDPFSVFADDKTINLINVACLEQTSDIINPVSDIIDPGVEIE